MSKKIDEQMLLCVEPILAKTKTLQDITDIEIQIKLLDKDKKSLTSKPFSYKIPKAEKTASISDIMKKYNATKYKGENIIKYITSAKDVAKELGIEKKDEKYKKISFLYFKIDANGNHDITDETKWFDVEIENSSRIDPNKLSISQKGIDFLKGYESEVKENGKHILYNDDAGYCTIGYGHLVDGKISCENISNEKKEKFKSGLTDTEAKELLQSDFIKYENIVKKNVEVNLYQHEFDALVSFVYNVGGPNFSSSTLLKKLNLKKYPEVPAEFLRWNKAGGKVMRGLTFRREAEAKIFKENIYDSTH